MALGQTFFYFESSVFCGKIYGEHYMARLPCHKMIINKDYKKPTYLSKTKKKDQQLPFFLYYDKFKKITADLKIKTGWL